MYCEENFLTKKALKEALARKKQLRVVQPGYQSIGPNYTGRVVLEGPHFPRPHTWYATADLVDGIIVRVK